MQLGSRMFSMRDEVGLSVRLQWVGLRRPHAEAIMRDERVFAAFKEYCISFKDKKGNYQQCKVCRCQCC